MKSILNVLLFSMCLFLLACAGAQDVTKAQKEKEVIVEDSEVLRDERGKQILPAARMPVGEQVKPEKARMQTEADQ